VGSVSVSEPESRDGTVRSDPALEASPSPADAPVGPPSEPAGSAAVDPGPGIEGPSAPSGSLRPDSPLAAGLQELDRLPSLDLAEHPDVYQRIHAELQGALAAIDDA
jgi:hypothetical protein